MKSIEELMHDLTKGDNNLAYAAMKELETIAETSPEVYRYFDDFALMLQSRKTYVKNRALVLISACAKWDTEDKISELLEDYMAMITYEKPITARWAIQNLPRIALNIPIHKQEIISALEEADCSYASESMRPLLETDINSALQKIKESGQPTQKFE